MRIIDKNTDFYDYLQDSTDPLVFDRRGSFLLEKKFIYGSLSSEYFNGSKYRFLLLQCCATFWLFTLTIEQASGRGHIEKGSFEVLAKWKNYQKPNTLLSLKCVRFSNMYKAYDYATRDYVLESIKKNVNDLVDAINHNNYENAHDFGSYKEHDELSVPLLKACGLAPLIDVQEIFCAIEEYFSIEKTKSETTEPKGATNDDKIIMHGFDTVTSFRGKRRNYG